MKTLTALTIVLLAVLTGCQSESPETAEMTPLVFVSFVGNDVQLARVGNLTASIREFAGRYAEAPIWVYGPAELLARDTAALNRLNALGVEVKTIAVPDETAWYFGSGMVMAAAKAEIEASGVARVVVLMGSDTIVLDEPSEFDLADGVNLGYRPVMHKNINPLMSEPLSPYWLRAYEILGVKEASFFPMVTPADSDTIRPYFNAGCIAVRPEIGLFGKWAESHKLLCADSAIRAMCEQEILRRIFTFQVALTGTILNNGSRSEMAGISDQYNYPIFFKEMYGAKRDFHDINGIVTMRYEHFFDNPIPGWETTLQGPPDKIAWLKKQCVGDQAPDS